MKSIIKIICIGLIAGLSYKFLKERNVNLDEKFREVREWAVSQVEALDKPAEDDSPVNIQMYNDDISSGESYSQEASLSGTGIANYTDYDHSSAEMSSATVSPENYPDAIEFPIEEKHFPGTERFPELDKYARETPEDKAVSIQSLAAWLSKQASNDLEKTRLIFAWVATHVSYDDTGFNTGNYSDVEAEGVLRNRVAVCQGYSNLFCELAKAAGLEAVVVTGYAKGISYRPGSRFSSTNHAWNAVKIDGEWKLFDATWGSGYGQGVNGKLVSKKRFDDYWFNTRPDEFIYSHLPEEEVWQFNEPKISLSQYERMPYAPGEYFKLGFNGGYLFQATLNGSIRELPQAYASDGDIQMVSMPSGKFIPRGTVIKVRIRSGNALRVAYRNNGNITDMKKEGNEFSADVITTPGPLRLMATFEEGDPGYHIFLDYEVR